MLYGNFWRSLGLGIILYHTPFAHSEDLMNVFKLSQENDPAYLQAKAEYHATIEIRPQALSRLLPAITLTAETIRNEQDVSVDGNFVGGAGNFVFNSHGYAINLNQPIFRVDRFIALQQASSEIKQAEAELFQAQQELIIRIAERYFDVLASIDNLEFAQAEVKSLGRQLDQANQRFEVGLSAITDVTEAQAGYDLAMAREIQAQNAIDNAREAVRELTGQYILDFETLGKSMPLVSPEPAEIKDWTDTALDQNMAIKAANFAADAAQKEINVQRSGHLPTLDIVASKRYDSTGGRFGGNRTHATAIGLQLNMPIYAGGSVNSQVRQAYENYNSAIHSLEQARRAAQRLTREAYLGVISGISQVNALNQAVISSETALEATEAGFDVGTRTAVDVVASQRATSEARRDFSRARYGYILDSLRLKQAAGTLSLEDLQIVNVWLGGEDG